MESGFDEKWCGLAQVYLAGNDQKSVISANVRNHGYKHVNDHDGNIEGIDVFVCSNRWLTLKCLDASGIVLLDHQAHCHY